MVNAAYVPEPQIGQALELIDKEQRSLGRMTLEDREGELLLGRFAAGPDFPAVETLFREFEEAVNVQALGAADRREAAIGALGLCLREAVGAKEVDVKDVQIWSDGGMSCLLGDAVGESVNGTTQEERAADRVREP